MAFCRHCGKEIDDQAVICIHCGCETDNGYKQKMANNYNQPAVDYEAKATAGQIVISVLIPLVGIILWAVLHTTKPRAAKTCLITGIVVWVVGAVVVGLISGLSAPTRYYYY